MPFVRVWIHAVWATKNRHPLLHDNIRATVFDHIIQNGKEKGIHIDRVNGYVDHTHALLALGNDQTLAKVIQLMKGESSYWINKHHLSCPSFEWQDEYYGASVSERDLDSLRRYIDNQEEHHRKKTFNEEYEELTKETGFRISPLD